MPTPREILDLPIESEDADADTIREYLVQLLLTLWQERDRFSGKRPFGASNWEFRLYEGLVAAGMVEGTFDQHGFLEEFPEKSRDQADYMIENAIRGMG